MPHGVIVLGIRCTDKANFQFEGPIGLHIEQAKHSPSVRKRDYLRFTGSFVGHAVEGASESRTRSRFPNRVHARTAAEKNFEQRLLPGAIRAA